MPDVTIKGMKYNPEVATVRVGGSVTWINEDSMTHTATRTSSPCPFDTGDVDKGSPVKVEFKDCAPGIYDYTCTYHPRMKGKVEVIP